MISWNSHSESNMKEIVWSTTIGYIVFHIEEFIVPGETQKTDTFLKSKIFISFDLITSATFGRSRGILGDVINPHTSARWNSG